MNPKLVDSIKTITGQHPTVFDTFERNFRSCISTVNLNITITGTIPTETVNKAVKAGLEAAALHAQEIGETDPSALRVSDQLWNPLVSMLLLSAALPTKEKTTKLAQSGKGAPDPKRSKGASQDRPKQNDAKSSSVSKDERTRITNELAASTSVYRNQFHKHVKCARNTCGFCTTMFRSVNLSKCIGHQPCSPCGWYPHVGPSLWKLLKKKHDKGMDCKFASKTPNSKELLAIGDPAFLTCEEMSLPSDPEVDYQETPSVPRTEETDHDKHSLATLRKRTGSPPRWCDEVDRSPKRRERSNSASS